MLSKNWKGNIIGSWSSIFLKRFSFTTVFHKLRQGNSFCYLEYAYLCLLWEWRGLREKLGCFSLLLSPVINKKYP